LNKYNYEYLNQLPLISNSNHRVYSDGTVFYKRARDNNSSANIVLEHTVNTILGRKSELFPGPPVSVLSERVGNSLTAKDVRESFVREALRVMLEVHYISPNKYNQVAKIVPSWNDFRNTMQEKIQYRIDMDQNPKFLLDVLPPAASCSNYVLGLVHSDPRPANWVREESGTLELIDWESALIAPWEFAVISLVSYLYEYGRTDLAHFAFDEAHEYSTMNSNLLQWSANYRTAATSSWYFANESFDSGMNWVNKMSELWINLKI